MLVEETLPATGRVVVIATASSVSAWRDQLASQANARVFSETDFLVALDAIMNDLPDVIALDPLFAATARGAALVARVKADPRLRQAEIRTLVGDGLSPHPPVTVGARDRQPLLSQPLDGCGTRRAPRFAMQAGIEARVNGTTSRLVNLSITGSQMVAPLRLRPSEDIRLSFSDDCTDLRISGTIAWVHLEIATQANTQRYRFGVEFRDAEQQAIEQFCQRHRVES